MDFCRATWTSMRFSQNGLNFDLPQLAREGKWHEVEELLTRGADINSEGGGNPWNGEHHQTALSWAAEMGHFSLVQLLVERKATIETRNWNAQTPLSLACQEGHRRVVRLLLEKEANIEAQDHKFQTPLFLADDPEVVQLLLEKSAQIKPSAAHDSILWAAANGHAEIVRLLLEKDAEIEKEDWRHYRQTPLALAARYGHAQIVELLLEKKAKIQKRHYMERTPLSLACQEGHRRVVQLLLEKEAEIEEECWSRTLSFAAEFGNLQIVKFLLEMKAEAAPMYHRTPFELATQFGHDDVSVLLLRHERKGDWTVKQLCWLIKRHNQDAVVREMNIWPKAAKQSNLLKNDILNFNRRRAPLAERLRPVLAPNEKKPKDPSDENCAAIIHTMNLNDLSQENLLWAPEVAVMLKVLPGVTGSDAINEEFLQTLAHTPHERIFETDAIQAMILVAWQQERFWTWLEILSCTTMVISLCLSSHGFRHGELMLAERFLWPAAVLHSKKSLNELVQLLAHLRKKLFKNDYENLEYYEPYSRRFWDRWYSRSYINFNNLADLLYIGSGWAAIGRQLSRPSNLEKPCMAIFCALSWLRLLYCLRGETWMGPRLLPILCAIKDTFAFFFLMTICIVAASHAYYTLEIRDEPWPTYAALMQIVRLGIFGDFDMFEFEGLDPIYTSNDADTAYILKPQDPDPGPHYPWVHALFYITGVGITVLLMNVLISVLSESYNRYAKQAVGEFFRARVNILVELQGRPLRRLWNCLKWACQRNKSQSIAQCPKGDLQNSIEQTRCNESENSWSQEEEVSTLLGLLKFFVHCLCVALLWSVYFVIWFALDLIGLNIDCLLCQLRFAWGSFGYIKPRLNRPGARAAAKQCAIFFLVRDEPESLRMELKRIESLDTRMQTVEKTVGGMHNKIETLEHRLEGQIETGFTQMRELIAGQTHRRRRRSSRNGRISPVEMRTDSSNHSKEVSHSEMTSAESRRPSKKERGQRFESLDIRMPTVEKTNRMYAQQHGEVDRDRL